MISNFAKMITLRVTRTLTSLVWIISGVFFSIFTFYVIFSKYANTLAIPAEYKTENVLFYSERSFSLAGPTT
jgi:hypothetical protein